MTVSCHLATTFTNTFLQNIPSDTIQQIQNSDYFYAHICTCDAAEERLENAPTGQFILSSHPIENVFRLSIKVLDLQNKGTHVEHVNFQVSVEGLIHINLGSLQTYPDLAGFINAIHTQYGNGLPFLPLKLFEELERDALLSKDLTVNQLATNLRQAYIKKPYTIPNLSNLFTFIPYTKEGVVMLCCSHDGNVIACQNADDWIPKYYTIGYSIKNGLFFHHHSYYFKSIPQILAALNLKTEWALNNVVKQINLAESSRQVEIRKK